MTKKIKFGIIGTGTSARMQATSVAGMQGIEIAALCDIRYEAIASYISKLRNQTPSVDLSHVAQYGSLDDFLRIQCDLDFVVVSTPSGLHAEIGMKVAEAHHNVVVEKPVDVTLQAADNLIARCEECGVKLYVISQNRYRPDVLRAKQILEQGLLGKIIEASINVPWYRTQEYYSSGAWRGTWKLDGGGALTNQGIHMVDLLVHLAGDVDKLRARGGILGHKKIEVEDWVSAEGDLKSGARTRIYATTCNMGGEFDAVANYRGTDYVEMRILGTNGILVLRDYAITQESNYFKDGRRVPIISTGAGIKTDSDPLSQVGHGTQLLAIGQAIRGDGPAMVTGEEARRALEVNMAVYQSIQNGGDWVKLPVDPAFKPDPKSMALALTGRYVYSGGI